LAHHNIKLAELMVGNPSGDHQISLINDVLGNKDAEPDTFFCSFSMKG
jgi:hypothetical protein